VNESLERGRVAQRAHSEGREEICKKYRQITLMLCFLQVQEVCRNFGGQSEISGHACMPEVEKSRVNRVRVKRVLTIVKQSSPNRLAHECDVESWKRLLHGVGGRCVKGILTDALPRHFREEREAEAADRGWCLQRGIRKRLWLLPGLAGTLFDARSGEKIPDCTPASIEKRKRGRERGREGERERGGEEESEGGRKGGRERDGESDRKAAVIEIVWLGTWERKEWSRLQPRIPCADTLPCCRSRMGGHCERRVQKRLKWE
jgi:hypothetical protein